MRVDKLKTNLGDTIKIIFKTKMEYEKWLQYVKDVCITCEKVDPIFQVIPKDLKENATENLDTGEYTILLLPEVTARIVLGFMELCVVQKRNPSFYGRYFLCPSFFFFLTYKNKELFQIIL